jgi:hypothetical protein
MTKQYFSMGDVEAYFAVKRVVGDNGKVKRVVTTGNLVKTQIVDKNGVSKTIGKRIDDLYQGTKNLAGKGLTGTAGLTARATRATGGGIATAGGFIGNQGERLAGAIERNPKAAGAIVLGGTLLGVGGGAYALSRRNQNN